MSGSGLGDDEILDVESGPVSVARVDQALNLEFAEDEKAQTFNACVPGDKTISVTLEEGFRNAWVDGNDISLMVSSGKISADDVGTIFDVTAEGGADELIIDVTPTGSDDSEDIAIKFEPAAGAVGDDIMLSAMILPERRTDESFMVSSTLVVGTYGACTGDYTLVFPFISNSSGFDTGVALINNSKVDGSCVLSWDGKVLDDEDVRSSDRKDVDAKDQTVFVLSMENAGFQGLLSVACSFGDAYGYAFITDTVSGSGAQGYVARQVE